MCRLVQGDVGSGKTMVAGGCTVCAAKTVCRARCWRRRRFWPSSIFNPWRRCLNALGLRCGLLTGSQKVSEKRALRAARHCGRRAGDRHRDPRTVVSGTTAFANLGLVVTDEQHWLWRGPSGRQLAQKGELPHFAAALGDANPPDTFHDPLRRSDVLILDEQLPGRQPVDTFLVSRGTAAPDCARSSASRWRRVPVFL